LQGLAACATSASLQHDPHLLQIAAAISHRQRCPTSMAGQLHRSRLGAAACSVLVDHATGLIALAIVVVFSLPWSFQLISDTGSGFLLLGHLPWTWLRSWWPTRHMHACQSGIFDRTGPELQSFRFACTQQRKHSAPQSCKSPGCRANSSGACCGVKGTR
jgi:hypothetical protein